MSAVVGAVLTIVAVQASFTIPKRNDIQTFPSVESCEVALKQEMDALDTIAKSDPKLVYKKDASGYYTEYQVSGAFTMVVLSCRGVKA